MKKNRLEAFTDGVFAIVITLLILELRLPNVAYAELPAALGALAPAIGVYVLSFVLIGMYWVFHHHSMTLVHDVDGVLLWLNIIFLLFISFMPFPTMMMGRYPNHTLPAVVYGCNLLMANLNGFVMLLYLRRNAVLTSPYFTETLYRAQVRVYLIVNGLYVFLIALAFFSPAAAVVGFAIMGVFLVLRSAVNMGIGRCVIGGVDRTRRDDATSSALDRAVAR